MEQQINFIPCCNPAESRMDLFPLSRRYRPAIIKKYCGKPNIVKQCCCINVLYMLKDSVSLRDIAT